MTKAQKRKIIDLHNRIARDDIMDIQAHVLVKLAILLEDSGVSGVESFAVIDALGAAIGEDWDEVVNLVASELEKDSMKIN